MSEKFNLFFDAFQSCTETKAAIESGKLSTSRKMLKMPVAVTPKQVSPPEPIPSPFGELLQIQGPDGRWQRKEDVFLILQIPPGDYFGTMEEWEEATTFAVAKIRQSCDLFHLLGDAHDRAMDWLSSTKFVRAALDVINACAMPDGTQRSFSASTNKRKQLKPPVDPYRETLERSSRYSYSRTMSALRSASMEAGRGGGSAEEVEQMQRAAERASMALEMLTPTLNYSALTQRILDIKQSTDLGEAKVVQLALKLDALRKEVEQCLHRCATIHQTSALMADRNASFDELTASLGDDVPPRVGLDGWQRQGKMGYRACVITLFNALNTLAHSRLLLREAVQTAASVDMTTLRHNAEAVRMKEVVDRILPEVKQQFDKRDNWHLSWGGKDLVLHVLHSLDFLGASPLLQKWYGTSYPFASNPFAFAFHLSELWPFVATDKQVEGYLNQTINNSRRSCRHLISSRPAGVSFGELEEDEYGAAQARREDRMHRDAVIAAQIKLDDMSNDVPLWWPRPTDVSDLNRVNTLFIAFLVLRLRIKMSPVEPPAVSVAGSTYKKQDCALSSSERGAASMSASAPPPGNKQVPPDFKAWLFTDDWYMNYGVATTAVSKVTAPRVQSSKKSRPPSEEGGANGSRRRKVSGHMRAAKARTRPVDGQECAKVSTAEAESIGGDLHALMEGDGGRSHSKTADVQFDEDDDLISVTDVEGGAPENGPHVDRQVRPPSSGSHRSSNTKAAMRGAPAEGGSTGRDDDKALTGDATHAAPAENEISTAPFRCDQSATVNEYGAIAAGRDDQVTGPQLAAVTAVPTAPMTALDRESTPESDTGSASGSVRSHSSRKKVRKKIFRTGNSRRTSAGATAMPVGAAQRARPQSSSGSILTPHMEKSVSHDGGICLFDASKLQRRAASSSKQVPKAKDDDSDSSASIAKRKLTLKERKERRKESLSARLQAAGIEGVRKGIDKMSSTGRSGTGGSLPDITRKTKVSRTSSQDPRVRLTRRVGETVMGRIPSVK